MEGKKITINNGILNVPDNPIVTFIEGDGIGPEVWGAAKIVMDAAIEKAYNGNRKIIWEEVLAGEKAYHETGEWLPDETISGIKEYLVAIKGPLTTPVGGGIRSLNVALRQTFDLGACVRPIRYYEGVPSPVKHPERVNMVVFRENTEDIYAGVEYLTGTEEADKVKRFLIDEMKVNKIRFPETTSIGIKPVSEEGTKRLMRSAVKFAIENNRKSVTIVHKGNIMKFTEGKFKEWSYEVAEEEFGDKVFTWAQYDRIAADDGVEAANEAQQSAIDGGAILIKDVIADAFLQQIILRPAEYDVIATLNLNGDYISDALAALVGGIGISPGANINYETGLAIFEATHGTAPGFAGKDKLNPSSMILSGVMLLEYLGWIEAAELIVKSVEKTIQDKTVTVDFAHFMEGATELKCSEFGNRVAENL